ncbi:MAG TPA: DEAD/DEAH box helicase, partial [Candidatus Thalassarchaeaceae archaeon]|nr:DEAD/DEAH box helicase [Candidatus Thalassarchaeaceae archaeon]
MDFLHPKVRDLIDSRNWTLSSIQRLSMKDLVLGHDRVLVSPTGSGKTEAAILPLASRFMNEGWEGLSILYITPLRALNRDIDRRLGEMLEPLGISVGLRHGDTSQKERTKQSKNPPNLLITTPETAQIMLLGSRLRRHLSGLNAVILDEVHDLASSERGAQLLVGLERIAEYCPDSFQRIGLSATVGNPNETAKWLSKDAVPIIGPSPRSTQVVVHREDPTPSDEAESVVWASSPHSVAAHRRLAKSLSEEYPALVFVNSRNAAESVSQRLRSLNENILLGVHHGSLAAETRKKMEDGLRNGELNAIVCTSSLELGIDIGSIKRVHQIQSPRAVDRLLQRMGRAEHVIGGTGRGELLAWETDEVAEGAVIARRAMAGELEGVEWRTNPGIVAANQFLQMSIERGVVPVDLATKIVGRCSIFKDWNRENSVSLLRVLSDRWMLNFVDNPLDSDVTSWPRKLWFELSERTEGDAPSERPSWEIEHSDIDKVRWRNQLIKGLPDILKNGWFSPSGRLGRNRVDHISMIPDELSYRVRDAVGRGVLGSVDEAFVLSLGGEEDGGKRKSRTFVMAGRTWQIVDADPDQEEILVIPIKDSGEVPVWSGELPPVPMEVAKEVGVLRRSIAVAIGAMEDDVRDLEDYPLSDEARNHLISTVTEHYDSSGVIPDDRTVTVSESDGAVIVNTCRGSRVNETLGHFLQAMGSLKDGKMGRSTIDPYRVSLQVPSLNPSDVVKLLLETPPSSVPSIMWMTIPNGRAIRWRVVQVARKMGILEKGTDPRKVNLEGLMQRYRGTPVIEESLEKLFHERMDIEGTQDLLKEISNGDVRVFNTPPGRLGRSPRAEMDLLLPAWSDTEIRERLETRLLNERAVLICLNCHGKKRRRVERIVVVEPCSTCGGTMLACAPERAEKSLMDRIESTEQKISGKVQRNAELVRTHGHDAILCLMGRGIGEETATRILRGPAGDRIRLLRAIHNA